MKKRIVEGKVSMSRWNKKIYSLVTKGSVRIVLSGLLVISPFALSACGDSDMDELVPAKDVSVNVTDMNTLVVEKGDLTPSYEKTATLSGYKEVVYRLEQNKLDKMEEEYEAHFDELKVEVSYSDNHLLLLCPEFLLHMIFLQ